MQIKKRKDKMKDIIIEKGGNYNHMYRRGFATHMFYNKLTYHQWLESFNKIISSLYSNSTYILKTKGYDYYKIGRSSNVEKRIKSLQTNCPFQLEILIKVADSSLNEKYWLKNFKEYKTHGEWFKFQDKQVRELRYIIKKINIQRYKSYLIEYIIRLNKEEEQKRYIKDYNNHMRGE